MMENDKLNKVIDALGDRSHLFMVDGNNDVYMKHPNNNKITFYIFNNNEDYTVEIMDKNERRVTIRFKEEELNDRILTFIGFFVGYYDIRPTTLSITTQGWKP